ncbi:MAG: hypothetical protein H8E44_27555 [Planctomycetes bacterium]|nr:hypothetical protein [Planctomycetota bacterium]MBL7040813.1 hypothetical protein [Pirellulaceae bacterium]
MDRNSSDTAATPKLGLRRWLRYSLSTLMIVVLVLSVPLGWHAMQRHQQRKDYLALIASASVTPHVTYGKTREIYLALQQETSFSFTETPLEKVASTLATQHKIPIYLDRRALEDVGIGSDVPITRSVKNQTLSAALREMLRDLELRHVVSDEVLLITTPEEVFSSTPYVEVYNVADLLRGGESADRLAKALSNLLPTTPEERDGRLVSPGYKIDAYHHLLLVRSTRLGHERLTEFLAMLRAGMNPRR